MATVIERETIYSKNGKIYEDVTHEGEDFLHRNIGEIFVMHVDKTVEEIETTEELLEALENHRKIVIEN